MSISERSNPQNGVKSKQHDPPTPEALMRSTVAVRSAPASKVYAALL